VVRERARTYALENAVRYGGRANGKAVLGKLLAEDPSLRDRSEEVRALVEDVVAEVNRMTPKAQREELERTAPELLERRKAPKEEGLPDLPGVGETVVLRLAPYPSGPLHIGNARAFLLNDHYAKRYGGRLYLVYDDTIGSEEKPIVPEAYDQIADGLEWLGIAWHDTVYKSDRLPIHYEWAERLIAAGFAYVCECPAETLRRNREAREACVHRAQPPAAALEGWRDMLRGAYAEGEAVLRVKTDMGHPNPAFRDRVLFRIAEREHPRTGSQYRVWPLLEFSWAVDDILLGITHVIRGKDLAMEDLMETFLWDAWAVQRRPVFVHYGILRFEGLELSKSRMRRAVEAGEYAGIDDPRTWSLQSLRRRGLRPEAVRSFLLAFGLSLSDVRVAAETLYAENRRLIDGEANRYTFVPDPVAVDIVGLSEEGEVRVPLHPAVPERGHRVLPTGPRVWLPRADYEGRRGEEIRLKDFCNVRLDGRVTLTSKDVRDLPKVQWLRDGVAAEVVMPDGAVVRGLAEPAVVQLPVGTVVQFERFGFVRLDAVDDERVVAYFAHR
jgi:glutamyl-tRNA synthetase